MLSKRSSSRIYLLSVTAVGLTLSFGAQASLGSLGDYINQLVQGIESKAKQRAVLTSDIVGQCNALKSQIGSYNDQLGQRAKDCASVGGQIKEAQSALKIQLAAREKAVVDINKFLPIASRSDQDIVSLAKKSTAAISEEIKSLQSSLSPLLSQQSSLKAGHSRAAAKASGILNSCIKSITNYIPERDKVVALCKESPSFQEAQKVSVSLKSRLDGVNKEVAVIEGRIDSLKTSLGVAVAKRIEQLFKERKDAFAIVAASKVSLSKTASAIGSLSAKIKDLKQQLWVLDEGNRQLCQASGAKTLPNVCK